MFLPRPAEATGWLDTQLAGLRQAREDVSGLLARQEAAREAAWQRFEQRHPHRVGPTRRKIARWAAVARAREAARSEVARTFWVLRAYVQRAGALTGHGDDLFFLSIQEILALL